MTLPLGLSRRAACAGKAIGEVGIRPEDIVLGTTGSSAILNGEVYVIEPMGNETLVVIRLGEERLSARARRGFRAPVGSAIGVSFDADDACFFDAAGTTVVHRDTRKGGNHNENA
jgi:multiple sugar transport system ATP-binding protein